MRLHRPLKISNNAGKNELKIGTDFFSPLTQGEIAFPIRILHQKKKISLFITKYKSVIS